MFARTKEAFGLAYAIVIVGMALGSWPGHPGLIQSIFN